MTSDTSTNPFADVGKAYADFLSGVMDVNKEMWQAFASFTGLASVSGVLTQARERIGRSCCTRPEPCWMPLSLGHVTSMACPGGSAVVRIRIANHSLERIMVTVEPSADTSGVHVTPASLALEPMRDGMIAASWSFDANASKDERHETVLWIRGCRTHYLHWTAAVAEKAGCSVAEVKVIDGADLQHHWYDHFVCARPCLHTQQGTRG
jgi:hypothetical protein